MFPDHSPSTVLALGSLNGLVLHIVAARFYPAFQGTTVLGAIACDPAYLMAPATVGVRQLQLIHYEGDELCVWHPLQH